MDKHYTQGGDEYVIISADRPIEYGTLDGDTIKVRSCIHEWHEQPGEPPVDVCSQCGAVRE